MWIGTSLVAVAVAQLAPEGPTTTKRGGPEPAGRTTERSGPVPAARAPKVVTVSPEEEPGVLINPGCGWQKLCHGPPQGEIEKMPMVSTYYYRACWTRYEPSPGKYENSPAVRVIDAWLKYASEHGRYVALRVVPYNSRNPPYQRTGVKVQGCDSPVPAYVFDVLGAKGFPEPGGSGGWVPVFWDPVYLKQHEKLIRFLGRKFDGHPTLAYVDIAAGNYGEMNLRNTGVPELDDLSKWKEYGLTPEAWDHMIRGMVQFYKEAFPNTLLVAARDYESYGTRGALLDHAVSQGVGFRDDGLGMAYCRNGRRNPAYERYWKQVPCLYENGYVDWIDWANYGTQARACVEWAVDETHACIVMVGKGAGAERSYERYADIVEEVGRRLGPRLRVKAARYVTPTRPRGNFEVNLVWTNSGNTPVYRDLDLEVALMRGHAYAARRIIPAKVTKVRNWLPGEDVPMKVGVTLRGLPSGKYDIRVSFFPPGKERDPRFRYKPAMKERDSYERALVGVVELSGAVSPPEESEAEKPGLAGGEEPKRRSERPARASPVPAERKPPREAVDPAAKLYREAETAFIDGDVGRARELFEAIVSEHPESKSAQKAREYLQILQ